MKSVMTAINNRDASALQAMSNAGQEQQPIPDSTKHIFNELFRQLKAAFPALTVNIKTQDELNELRRQWLLAFAENRITTIEQVNSGMRIARQQETPFLPSPGLFIAWCRQGEQQRFGLPTASELVTMVYEYCKRHGYYDSPESYPWDKPEHYWMVTALYSGIHANGWNDGELRRKAATELAAMASRISRGEHIPAPKVMIPTLGGKPLSQSQGLEKISELRAKHGLKGGAF